MGEEKRERDGIATQGKEKWKRKVRREGGGTKGSEEKAEEKGEKRSRWNGRVRREPGGMEQSGEEKRVRWNSKVRREPGRRGKSSPLSPFPFPLSTSPPSPPSLRSGKENSLRNLPLFQNN